MNQEVKIILEVTLSVDAEIKSNDLKNMLIQTVGAYSCNTSKASVISERILEIKEEAEIYKTSD